MKREWLLLAASVTVTVLVAIGLIRWFAPGLLGISTDLRLVQVAEEVPPFYRGVFRREDRESAQFILNDPDVIARAKPLFPNAGGMGPNDILGFRNRAVPNVTDIIAIGDSQTYGNNAPLDDNWPSRLSRRLPDHAADTYAMATGGWGAAQYLNMAYIARFLRPRLLIVAFYSGNDPLDSFRAAYATETWAALRRDPKITIDAMPRIEFPPPQEEWWPVRFADGSETVFTPRLRHHSNRDHPAVRAGWAAMAEAARQIDEVARNDRIELIFTIIPTKELAYAEKVKSEGIDAPEPYRTLIEDEARNIAELARTLSTLEHAGYVDLVAPLQQALLTSDGLYPPDTNGHPMAAGYDLIAEALVDAAAHRLPKRLAGLAVRAVEGGGHELLGFTERGVWSFDSAELAEANGWRATEIPLIDERDLAGVARLGRVTTVDPERFAPR